MTWPLYHYRAQALHVVDGDTVDLKIDFGAFISRTFRCRLLGIDTPEIFGADSDEERRAGQAAKTVLTDWLGTKVLYIKTDLDKNDKYGRLLVTIYDAGDAEISLNRLLVDLGYAKPSIGWERVA